ncbi:MAG TPA: class I SAM-dependent methyltransferase [Blastocatellia bacterium]|nr:class I SAM-dependent methyltransferase [Blastocatellia bacterium]HMV85177.1 class I SAM-dependent methyltransferase [Blastocatellia bacterium]HMX26141.1 class I SAM-dependent methyltransferase [Blastocatellia bacterium]HMY71281.1 class I SAM-dependent methyltransferase [Blastocatellia bacterium]HMZ18456.1 class I SAM-dependent methyltransferase [Blastocatellia bacterium]
MSTPRLDGPLVRCRCCGLFYVVLPEKNATQPDAQNNGHADSSRIAAEMVRLSERARELALVEPEVEQSEKPWRELMARERLEDLRRFVTKGRLLEVGCSTGEMLAAAQSSFAAFGVEADEAASRIAATRGLDCSHGTLADARFPDAYFDVAALYHVIEHFPSPRAELRELHRVIAPGGWLTVETPNIENIWFRFLGARWRQFIPDHIFFFTPATLARMCEESGFEIRELRSVGKAMSARLFISRVGRYSPPAARVLSAVSRSLNLDDRTLRLNFGDVMRLYARRR